MPHYDYTCTDCGHKEEVFQKISDCPLTECFKCSRQTFKRAFGIGTGLQFKTPGFYITDYAKNEKSSVDGGLSSNTSCACKKSCDS